MTELLDSAPIERSYEPKPLANPFETDADECHKDDLVTILDESYVRSRLVDIRADSAYSQVEQLVYQYSQKYLDRDEGRANSLIWGAQSYLTLLLICGLRSIPNKDFSDHMKSISKASQRMGSAEITIQADIHGQRFSKIRPKFSEIIARSVFTKTPEQAESSVSGAGIAHSTLEHARLVKI